MKRILKAKNHLFWSKITQSGVNSHSKQIFSKIVYHGKYLQKWARANDQGGTYAMARS